MFHKEIYQYVADVEGKLAKVTEKFKYLEEQVIRISITVGSKYGQTSNP